MSFRQLFIAKKCHLTIEHNNVSIKIDESKISVPIEDILIIVVDNQEVTFSSTFISLCAENNVVVAVCGRRHIPVAQILPNNTHYRLYEVLKMQLALEKNQKSMIAELLLKQKVFNQKQVLQYLEFDEETIKLFDSYINEIEGNDRLNREGTAAKVFFNRLYSKEYTRFEDDVINSVQNYGYAIFAACLARQLTSLGLNLCLGVNHEGNTNPLNLVYDLIEPFRAIVDYYIYQIKSDLTDSLNIQTKKELVNLLNVKVKVNGILVTVQYAMELLAKSYLRSIEFGILDLDLPIIVETNFYKENEQV